MDYVIPIADQLSAQLRSMRKARGLSQAGLALKLGVSQSRIAAIEGDPSTVSTGQLMELLKVLGVDLVLRDRHTPVGTPPDPSTASDNGPKGEW